MILNTVSQVDWEHINDSVRSKYSRESLTRTKLELNINKKLVTLFYFSNTPPVLVQENSTHQQNSCSLSQRYGPSASQYRSCMVIPKSKSIIIVSNPVMMLHIQLFPLITHLVHIHLKLSDHLFSEHSLDTYNPTSKTHKNWKTQKQTIHFTCSLCQSRTSNCHLNFPCGSQQVHHWLPLVVLL